MHYDIKFYRAFLRQAKKLQKRYRSFESDLRQLTAELKEHPEAGSKLAMGCYKVRMSVSSKGKGKRGGLRVITLIVHLSEGKKEIGLHYIYDKSDRESITDKELVDILRQNGLPV